MTRTAKKVVLFSPPFDGHLNVIKDLVQATPEINWKVVITGWTNIAPNLGNLADKSVVLANYELQQTDPALWTFPRVASLLGDCIEIVEAFQPDLIIYDFFSLEGKLAGDKLGIPAWCSVTAFMGDFTTKDYMLQKLEQTVNKEALQQLSSEFGIDINVNELEMVSDGFHMPAEVNLVWSYESLLPEDTFMHRKDAAYVFLGSSKELNPRKPVQSIASKPLVYFSLGTVVMDNLWNQHEHIRTGLRLFIQQLAVLWKDAPFTVLFVTQGKTVLPEYPDNWEVLDRVNQAQLLHEASLFVTHGGNNSFHESLVAGVPMVVLPFFGDQPLVAQQVQHLGFGINVCPDVTIDTNDAKPFLTEQLAETVDAAVQKVLADPTYARALQSIDATHTDIRSLFTHIIDFNEGDLLFGTNVARQHYVQTNDIQKEFTILEFKAFSELAPHETSLPRIVDIYHDVILSEEHFGKDIQSKLSPYVTHLQEYKDYLAGETDFEKMCIKGLDFFSQYYKVHFILSDYDPQINLITKAEINHILGNETRFKDVVTFYEKAGAYWVPISFSKVRNRYS